MPDTGHPLIARTVKPEKQRPHADRHGAFVLIAAEDQTAARLRDAMPDQGLAGAGSSTSRTWLKASSIFCTSTVVLKQGPKGRSLRMPITGRG